MLYAIVGLLAVVPLLEIFVAVFPPRFLEVGWRFGALGLLSRSLLFPVIALLLSYVAAIAQERRSTAVILGWVGLGTAVLMALCVIVFALDATQTIADVSEGARRGFILTSGEAVIKYFAYLLASAVLAWDGLKRRRDSRTRTSPDVLVSRK